MVHQSQPNVELRADLLKCLKEQVNAFQIDQLANIKYVELILPLAFLDFIARPVGKSKYICGNTIGNAVDFAGASVFFEIARFSARQCNEGIGLVDDISECSSACPVAFVARNDRSIMTCEYKA